MFVIINMWNMFHTHFEDMFMFHIHTTIHMPRSNSSLFITIKPKVKYRFQAPPYCFTLLTQKNLIQVALGVVEN